MGQGGRQGSTEQAGGAADLVGATVAGKYQVEAHLTAGGMGVIYRARQQPLDRVVALKVLSLRHGEVDADFERRFYLEAATCAKLSHANIVVVHDYGRLDPEQGGACFMVMELIEGRTIAEALEEEGPLDPMRVIRILRDIARALRAAHRRDVIHRDLKPSNVMLERTPEGERVKVLDFGLVKVLRDEAEQITQEGEFLGSPRFMAPEQIEHAPMDARSDIYSLGALVYMMLTGGHPPFERDSQMAILLAHLHDPVPPLASHGVAVPEELERVVRRCLEKAPADRYGSVEDLLADLSGVWAGLADPDLARSDAWSFSSSSQEAVRVHPATVSADALPIDPVPLDPPPAAWPRKLAFAVLALGVVAIAIVFAVAFERRGAAAEPRVEAGAVVPTPVPVSPAADPAPAAVAPAPPPAPEAPAPRFSLLVESTPPGARLTRDGQDVGPTPATIELETAALEQAPVTLSLALPGHHPFTWTQGPLGRDGRIHAALVRRGAGPRPATSAATAEPAPAEPAEPEVLPWARPNPY